MSTAAAIAWAQSGLMHLSGPEHGAPLVPEFDFMSGVAALLRELQQSAAAAGSALQLDSRVLTQRAQLMGLSRGGTQSCNRSCRLLEARDGWIALNLPRPSDVELLPAWLGIEVGTDPWLAVERSIRRFDQVELEAMGEGLPLAFAVLRPVDAAPANDSEPGLVPTRNAFAPLVVDLSSLWAGPLCGQLLHQAGARVIKVESATRPEPIRQVWPRFFDQLHAGKESVVLDFNLAVDRWRLKRLIDCADIVITSARPRAIEQLGFDLDELFRQKPALIWIGITAYGWYGGAGQRIGFGDDAAAAAGLVTTGSDGRPAFLGDAVADPLAGIIAASWALRAWRSGAGGIHDVSLHSSAQRIAMARRLTAPERGKVHQRHEHWWLTVDDCTAPVAPPQAVIHLNECAAAPGAHTRQILEEFTQASVQPEKS